MLGDRHVRVLDQISVFLENRPGCLSSSVNALAERGVNLRALAIAETERFGIARLIVDDNATALSALGEAGITTTVSRVIGVEVPDRPGGLAHLLTLLDGVSVEYMYAAFTSSSGNRVMIMKLTPLEEALAIIEALEGPPPARPGS